MNYKLSFIVPVYNRAKLLPRCLDSVLKANRDDVEIIMVDDASTDNSVEVAKSYVDRYSNVKLIECKENGGPGVARNIGMDNAQGDFLLFLDSDDMIVTENIGKLIDALDDSVDVIMFNTRTQSFGRELPSQTPHVERAGIVDSDGFFDILGNSYCSFIWSYCFHREFLSRYTIRFLQVYRQEDMHFMIQALIYADVFVLIPEFVYNYIREDSDSLANTRLSNRFREGDDIALSLVSDMLASLAGKRYKWLFNLKNQLLWTALKENRDSLPGELEAKLEGLSQKISKIRHRIWFMPATSFRLYRELNSISSFSMGGFLDNVPDDENMNVGKLRAQGYSVCLPEDIRSRKSAIVLFFSNSAVLDAALKQLIGLGYHLVMDDDLNAPKILINYSD